MSKSRDQLKILLLSFRDDEVMRGSDLTGFSRESGLSPEQFKVFSVPLGAPQFELLDEVDGIVIGGSKWSVFEEVPNLAATKDFLKEAKARKVPVLGVCFGHQLLALTFGGEVVRDEANEEFGSYDVTLNETGRGDALLSGLPETFKSICGHHDAVSRMPEGAELLASTEKCPIHSFRFSDAPVYGVQFHPEHSAESFERVMNTVGRKYFSDDGKVDSIISRIDPAPHASSVLSRFMDRIVLAKD